MSLINIHDTVSSARVEPLSLAQDRGKSEVRIGEIGRASCRERV